MTPTTDRCLITILLLVCLHGANGFGRFNTNLFGSNSGSAFYPNSYIPKPEMPRISGNNLVQGTVSGVRSLNSVAYREVQSYVKRHYRISVPRFSLACAYKRTFAHSSIGVSYSYSAFYRFPTSRFRTIQCKSEWTQKLRSYAKPRSKVSCKPTYGRVTSCPTRTTGLGERPTLLDTMYG